MTAKLIAYHVLLASSVKMGYQHFALHKRIVQTLVLQNQQNAHLGVFAMEGITQNYAQLEVSVVMVPRPSVQLGLTAQQVVLLSRRIVPRVVFALVENTLKNVNMECSRLGMLQSVHFVILVISAIVWSLVNRFLFI